jgi:hypothetical protein
VTETEKEAEWRLDELKERRGYWELKEEALDRIPCITGYGAVYAPVIRETTE